MSKRIAYTFLLLAPWLLVSPLGAQTVSEYYEDGIQAYAEDEYPEAYIYLKNALQLDAGFIPARVLLAKLHFTAGDTAGALKEAEEALALGADINLVLPTYGTSLILLDRADELFELEQYEIFFTEANQYEWALLKGQVYMLRGELDLARTEFERAAKMYPEDVRSYNMLASLCIGERLFDEASALIEKSLTLEPENVKTYELRAGFYMAREEREKALLDLERAFELDSEDIRVLRGLARVHMLLGNVEELSHYLELLLEVSPNDPAATILGAIVEIQSGDQALGNSMLADLSLRLAELDAILPETSDRMLFFQATADYLRRSDRSAISLFNTYLRRNPDDLAAIRLQSELYIRNKEYSLARELLNSQRELISNDLTLMVQLTRLYIDAGLELNARELLAELKARDSDEMLTSMLEAELLRSLGEPEAALDLLVRTDYMNVPVAYVLLRGSLLLQLNRMEEAEAIAKVLQTSYPAIVSAHNFAGTTYLKLGNLEAAETAIQAAIEISTHNVEARFNQAMLMKAQGDLEGALHQTNGILTDEPGHIRSIMLMAGVMYEQGKEAEAVDWSRKVYAYDKVSRLPDEFQLSVYTDSGNWSEALKAVLQLSKLDPLNENYLLRQVEIYIQLEDFETVQRPLRGLFALWENDPQKLLRLAQLQINTKSYREARFSLETALSLEPDLMSAQLTLANLDILEKDYDAAIKQLDAIEELHGPTAGGYLARGDIALAEENLQAAQAFLLKSYQLELSAGAVTRLYDLSSQGVGTADFINALEETIKSSSLPPWAVRLLADTLLTEGESARAIRYYELLLEHPQFKEDAVVLNNLANLYAEYDLHEAYSVAIRALEVSQDKNHAVLDTLGWILTRQGKYDLALPYLRRAYAINSRDPEVRYHTAVALAGLDRKREALTELLAALAGSKEFSGRKDAEAMLRTLERELESEVEAEDEDG